MPHRTKSRHGRGPRKPQQPDGTVRNRGGKLTLCGPRKPMPWLANKAGTRFVRDGSLPGCVPKRIARGPS